MDVQYKIFNDKPVIYLFGKTTDNQQICVIDENFQPYFYAIVKKEDSEAIQKVIQAVTSESRGRIIRVTRTEIHEKKYIGKEVTVIKIYTSIPKDVPILAREIKSIGGVVSVNEYDIRFVRRYLIDNDLTPITVTEAEGDFITQRAKVPVFRASSIKHISNDSIKSLKILAFDIETYNPHGKAVLPDINPIVMISLYGKELGSNEESFKKVLTWKRFNNKLSYIEFLKSEADMLVKFKEMIETFKPDILTGYFSNGFDFPYIITRADKYKIPLDFGWDYSEVKLKKGTFSYAQVNGMIHLDICKFIQRALATSLKTDTYSLDEVSNELLGEKKHKIDMEKLAPAWDSSSDELECFAAYNLQDSRLTFMLCEKLLPNLEEFVKLVGLPLYDINGMSFSQFVEWYLIKEARHYDEIAPNNPDYKTTLERRGVRVKGAFVFEPKPGLYKDIVVYDFRSLYPSIIISHNIGPETLNCDCCTPEYVPIETHQLWFCKKKKGFMSSVLENIVTRRMRIKEILKETTDENKKILLKARSETLKLLSNSYYGYLGFYGARWYSKDSARSTTAYARYYIKDVIAKAQEAGFKVIYSDTDSVFLSLDNKTKDESKAFAKSINENLPGLMELEFEGYYPSGIFVSAKLSDIGAKKKYALMDETGKMKITGFEAIRRNWSQIAKTVQEHVLEIILKEDNIEKAFNYVKNVIYELKNRAIDTSEVQISTQLQREIDDYESIGPHVAAAIRMKELGYDVGPGSMINFVVTEGPGPIRDRVKLPEEIENNEYDTEYYINNQILPAVDRIFAVLGYDIKELLEDKEQSKLDSFF